LLLLLWLLLLQHVLPAMLVLHFLQCQVGLLLALKFHKGKRGIHNSAMVSSILSKSSLKFCTMQVDLWLRRDLVKSADEQFPL